jgi:hypothetical protein
MLLRIPYYRDEACLDDGTGDDPVQRPNQLGVRSRRCRRSHLVVNTLARTVVSNPETWANKG